MLNADWSAIKRDLDSAGHGMKRAVVERHAERLGCHPTTIYRELAKKFEPMKTVQRQKQIPQALIERIAAIKSRSRQLGLGSRELATDRCIQILQDMNIEGADDLTVSTVNRRLREMGFRKEQPYRRIEAEFANQEHQLDWSRSKYFQLRSYDDGRSDYLLEIAGRELHYKQGNDRLRTWLVQVKDSYSRLRLCRMYAASGESALIALDFLQWCWTRDEDDHPMRYLPHVLKLDNGATARRKEFRAAADALGIEIQTSRPYNSQSQGKIESAWRSTWQRFELDLATRLGDGGTIWLAEYNSLLHEHLAGEDADLAHPILRGTRAHAYRTSIRAYPPRSTDADVVEIACRAEERTVGLDCTVNMGGQKWEAPEAVAGERIIVHRNARGELVAEALERQMKPFRLTPFYPNQIGDFRGPQDTAGTRHDKAAAEEIARPLGTPQESTVRYLPPKPETVEPDSPFTRAAEAEQPEPITAHDARLLVNRRLKAASLFYDDFAHVFDPMVIDNATAQEVDAVCTEILRRKKAQ
jgi:transposase InsO family protein